MKSNRPEWLPESDPIILSFRNRLYKKIKSIELFLKSPACEELPLGLIKSIKSMYDIFIEADSFIHDFQKESENHIFRKIQTDAMAYTISQLQDELNVYKAAEKFILSDEKKNLIETIVKNFDTLSQTI